LPLMRGGGGGREGGPVVLVFSKIMTTTTMRCKGVGGDAWQSRIFFLEFHTFHTRAHSTCTHALLLLLLTHHTHSIELASRHSALVRLLPSYRCRRRRSPSSPSFRCERWQQSLAFRAPLPFSLFPLTSTPTHGGSAQQ